MSFWVYESYKMLLHEKIFSYHLKIRIQTFWYNSWKVNEKMALQAWATNVFLSQVISSFFTISKIEWESNQAANWYDIQNSFLEDGSLCNIWWIWWNLGKFTELRNSALKSPLFCLFTGAKLLRAHIYNRK